MSEALAAAVTGAPIVSMPAGEPSMESLAALLPDPTPAAPSAVAQPGAERGHIPVPPQRHEDAPAEEAEAAAPEEATEAPKEEVAAKEEAVDQDAQDALKRSEDAARKAREGSRRYREALEASQRQKAEAQRIANEAEENRRKAEDAKRFQDALRKDPYAALKSLGMTDQELAERALREGTPEQEFRTLLERQREELAAERQRRQQLEDRIEEERKTASRQQAEANFHRLADDDRTYPRLAQLAPVAQLAVAQAALRQIASNGYDVAGLSDPEVAEACERFLAPKKAAKAAPPAKAAAPAAPAKTTNTLTNAVTAQRATAPRPWEELSEDEQISAIAASLPDPG